MANKVRRNYAQQFAAVVKHRRKGIPDDDQFVELLNEYLNVFDMPPLSREEVLGLEGDKDGGVPKIINAYLSFFGVALVIDEVQRGDYGFRSTQEIMRGDKKFIALTQERMDLLRKTKIGGDDFTVQHIQIKVRRPEGTMEYVTAHFPRNHSAWTKVQDAMYQLLFEAIEDRKHQMEIAAEKLSAPKPKGG